MRQSRVIIVAVAVALVLTALLTILGILRSRKPAEESMQGHPRYVAESLDHIAPLYSSQS